MIEKRVLEEAVEELKDVVEDKSLEKRMALNVNKQLASEVRGVASVCVIAIGRRVGGGEG
jgi:hypothetical protein